MRRSYVLKFFVLMSILVIVLFFVAGDLGQAQGQSKGKPDKPPDKKPPKLKCNNDGICQTEEYDCSKMPEEQPCEDCLCKSYNPLTIEQDTKQIAKGSRFVCSTSRVYQYKCIGGSYNGNNIIGDYEDTWASHPFEGQLIKATSIGDIDHDGEKEIVGVAYSSNTKGKGYNKFTTYEHKIYMFKDGSDGSPESESDLFGPLDNQVWDSIIADVDTDGLTNELVVANWYSIIIYKWEDGVGFKQVWASPDYGYRIYNVEVGDADNDGDNEIVLAMWDVGCVYVLEYLGEDSFGNKIWSDPICTEMVPEEYWNPNISPGLRVDTVRVVDADNKGMNEIVAGGNNNRFMVWRNNLETGLYDLVFVSPDLGGCTPGIDVGDINGDLKNEVILSPSDNATIYVFEYVDEYDEYMMVNSISFDSHLIGLEVGDIDNDGRDEIATHSGGLRIFDFIGDILDFGYLQETYFASGGGYFEID